jgi:hypothetical protein
MSTLRDGLSTDYYRVMGGRKMDTVVTAYEKALKWYQKETGKVTQPLDSR